MLKLKLVCYGVIHLHTNQSTVIIICRCPPVKEPGRMEKKSRLETRGKSRKPRQRN